MSSEPVSMLAVGDLILDEPDSGQYFAPTSDTLKQADVVVAQVDMPFSSRGIVQEHAAGAVHPPGPPSALEGVADAGIAVATLAGNHVYDGGAPAVEDTIINLRTRGVVTTGAGLTLSEARRPAIVERRGKRFGFLSYNCVGPKTSWAGPQKAGCAYVEVLGGNSDVIQPSGMGLADVGSYPSPESLEFLRKDIAALRLECDILVVALHKGIGHTPIKLAAYERPLAHAAIDAGADVILGHHAHILKGVEMYRGKPIFHGLGNFVCVTNLWKVTDRTPADAWARKRRELFTPDPEYPDYNYHPDAKHLMIAKYAVDEQSAVWAGYIPCFINKSLQPEIVKRGDGRAQQVFEYVTHISREAGLDTRFSWNGDDVHIETA